jgi:hypothetical protein
VYELAMVVDLARQVRIVLLGRFEYYLRRMRQLQMDHAMTEKIRRVPWSHW